MAENPLLVLLRRIDQAVLLVDLDEVPGAADEDSELFAEAEALIPEEGGVNYEGSVLMRDFDRYWRRGKMDRDLVTAAIDLIEKVLVQKGVL